MSKDLSQYFQPEPKAEQARGQTTQIVNFDEAPFTGESNSPKVVDQNLDEVSFLDGVDFDALEARNEAVADSGEELTDDGDCDGCKI